MEQLRATAARLEPQAAEAGVQLNIKGDDDLVINGEADQIDSAVTKLIENANRLFQGKWRGQRVRIQRQGWRPRGDSRD